MKSSIYRQSYFSNTDNEFPNRALENFSIKDHPQQVLMKLQEQSPTGTEKFSNKYSPTGIENITD